MPTALEQALAELMEHDQESVLALTDIAVERVRQIKVEGWSTHHDDEHGNREMARAAAAYAASAAISGYPHSDSYRGRMMNIMSEVWPWAWHWLKPKSPHRDCVRAGALLVAELARFYRMGTRAAAANDTTSR
jgi:hypothetical protein